ncbi:MAG: DUF4278 domain-containing protein [Cyanobacteria bacterium J06634_6]
MKLTYRGIEYDYNPPMLEVTESDVTCQYRGHQAAYTYVRYVPIPQPAEHLTYRGVAYQTNRYGQVQPIVAAETADVAASNRPANAANQGLNLANLRSKLTGTSPAAQARRKLLSESSRLHKDSIARSLAHRIEVAKAAGNDVLLQQLETEMRQSV